MSVRRAGLSLDGGSREVERRAGRREAVLEIKDMIVRVDLQGCEARGGPRRMSQPLNATRVRGSFLYNDYPWSSGDPQRMIEPLARHS